MTEAEPAATTYARPPVLQNAALRADPRYPEPLAEAPQYAAPREKLSLLARLPQLMRREIEPEHELIEPPLSHAAALANMPTEDRIRSRIMGAIRQRTEAAPEALSPLAAAIARREPPVVARPQAPRPTGPQPLIADTRPAAPPLRAPLIEDVEDDWPHDDSLVAERATPIVQAPVRKPAPSRQAMAEAQPTLRFEDRAPAYELPPLSLLSNPSTVQRHALSHEALEENARMLESVLDDYGVKGEITSVRPGPVVTMYELEPAPGLKASRVIGLSDDIARSMSALSARVSTVPGRTVIGIELPNAVREKGRPARDPRRPRFRRQRHAPAPRPWQGHRRRAHHRQPRQDAPPPHRRHHRFGQIRRHQHHDPLAPLQTLARGMPPDHDRPQDAGTFRLRRHPAPPLPRRHRPQKGRRRPEMGGREMEDRYRKMSKMGVRNIEGFNGRVREALGKNEMFKRTIQTGFDDDTGEPVFETEEFAPVTLPYIVVVVDEMADLMMVAGKEIEACIQRLAQMARASGIHLIMATQRPSVDVITGTIKANFPTRISFQVTSRIDSRTILGEQGAEQLLGMGDMLYMAGGGKVSRIHGPFVSDEEVEEIVTHLKSYGPPVYMSGVVEGPDDDRESDIDAVLGLGSDGLDDTLYDQAVAIVAKDRKCSTSYIQRKLGIGYNKAAKLVEQMEEHSVVTPANHVGKREILIEER